MVFIYLTEHMLVKAYNTAEFKLATGPGAAALNDDARRRQDGAL
jgi:hypothetical protein